MYDIPGNAYIIQINKQRFATIAQVQDSSVAAIITITSSDWITDDHEYMLVYFLYML